METLPITPDFWSKLLEQGIVGFALVFMIVIHWMSLRDLQKKMDCFSNALYELPLRFFQVFKNGGIDLYPTKKEK